MLTFIQKIHKITKIKHHNKIQTIITMMAHTTTTIDMGHLQHIMVMILKWINFS